MTYLELCQRLREEAGLSGSGPTTVSGQQGQLLKLVQWVRSAWNDIQTRHTDWNFLWRLLEYDTSPGEDAYTTGASNISRVKKITVRDKLIGKVDESVVTRLEYDELVERYGVGIERTGRPQHYAIRPDNAIVYAPTPDKVFVAKVEYYRRPQILTANSDVPVMPAHHHDLIVYRALLKFAAHYEATAQYQDAKGIHDELMSNLELEQLPKMGITGPLA
jgi:hypothetical protein